MRRFPFPGCFCKLTPAGAGCGPAVVLLAVLAIAAQTGCVQRRMTVRSNPPGALVYVDDQATPIGVTPVAHDFVYYGTRKFRLVKDGYETLTELRSIPAPWYEIPPLDFVSENLVPGEIRDHRCLDFQMKPQMMVPTDQLRARAENLRRNLHGATGTAPFPGAVATGPVPPGAPPTSGAFPAMPGQPVPGPVVPGPVPGYPGPSGPAPSAPPMLPPPGMPETVPTPPGVGGQPVPPLPSQLGG